jgi:hypothetical protein
LKCSCQHADPVTPDNSQIRSSQIKYARAGSG